MKKLILAICAIGLMAGEASALSFKWTATGVSFDGSRLNSNDKVTGYLIYLGTGASLSESYTVTAASDANSIASSIGTKLEPTANKTSAVGKLTGTFTFDYGTYDNGDAFAVLLEYTGAADGKTYYNLASDVVTLSGIADERSTISDAAFSFSYSTAGEKSSIASGGGWTAAVPEPSTAALALAGLALLLKRRKA